MAGLVCAGVLAFRDFKGYTAVYVGKLPSGHLFLAEHPDHPGLKRLRRGERLDEITGASGHPLEQLQKLARWSSVQFPPSTPFPHYPPWDANLILSDYRQKVTGDFCAQYAILFGQAAQSYGYLVRYVDLATEDKSQSHFITAVYLPTARRWVAFEPSQGYYYVDAHGRPLGVLDIHRRWRAKAWKDVCRSTDGQPVPPAHVALFNRFRIYLRNNFLSVPVRVARVPVDGGTEYRFEPYRLTWVGDEPDASDPRFQTSRDLDLQMGWDTTAALSISVYTHAGFKRLYRDMEPGSCLLVRIPTRLIAQLLDAWIGDARYVPLTE